MTDTLVVRVDANVRLGTGHFMRCLALAQAWQESGGTCHFIMADSPPFIQSRLTSENVALTTLNLGYDQLDVDQTIALAKILEAYVLILDGYHFDASYQKKVKEADIKLLIFDDYGHASHYWADFILNQNISAKAQCYANRESYSQLLLGTKYTLLRREFWPYRDYKRQIPVTARKILVTLGGSDPDNVTDKVIQALKPLSDIEIKVIVGGSNPHYSLLAKAVSDAPFIQLYQSISNMPEVMVWADVAISAGGSTCWELAYLGVPSLIVILADNQQLVVEELDRFGAAINLGWYHQLSRTIIITTLLDLCRSSEKRSKISLCCQQLVDGIGGERVVDQIV